MNKFYKVSLEQFKKDMPADFPKTVTEDIYNNLKLPRRATKHSAGYDIFAPFDIILEPKVSLKIPTGIKVDLDSDKFLAIYPRSGLGFKYRLMINNTVGIIDSDYINSDNEGHIFVKLYNGGTKPVTINQGEGMCQGIIQQYFTVEDDSTDTIRNGGFGSTTK